MKKISLLAILGSLLISCQVTKKSSGASLAAQPIEAIQLTGADTLIVTTGLAPIREKPDFNSIQLLEVVADSILITHEKIGNYYKVIVDKAVGYVSIAFAKPYSINANGRSSLASDNATRSTLSSKGCPSVQCNGYIKLPPAKQVDFWLSPKGYKRSSWLKSLPSASSRRSSSS